MNLPSAPNTLHMSNQMNDIVLSKLLFVKQKNQPVEGHPPKKVLSQVPAMAVTPLVKLTGFMNDLRYVDIVHKVLAQMQPMMSQSGV